jgi:nucleoid-associated protein YgaU
METSKCYTNKLLAAPICYLICISISISSCSTIKDMVNDSGEALPSGAFRGTAAIRNQTIPLPVDIAENILAIENGQIIDNSAQQNKEKENNLNAILRKKLSNKKSAQMIDQTHPLSGRRKFTRSTRSPDSSFGKKVNYKVKAGDTLMKIAYSKYGDIFRWRDIYSENQHIIKNYNQIKVGQTLLLNGDEFVVIDKNGEPYLIRKGDTLVKISKKIYQSPLYWRRIWKNNSQLIRDPNKIYAGFTIYYRPKSEFNNNSGIRKLNSN